jgi:hypothetical protein
MKVTDLKSFIYADYIMIWGDNVKGLKIRSGHWQRDCKNYSLQINLEKTVMLKLSSKKEKTQQ